MLKWTCAVEKCAWHAWIVPITPDNSTDQYLNAWKSFQNLELSFPPPQSIQAPQPMHAGLYLTVSRFDRWSWFGTFLCIISWQGIQHCHKILHNVFIFLMTPLYCHAQHSRKHQRWISNSFANTEKKDDDEFQPAVTYGINFDVQVILCWVLYSM